MNLFILVVVCLVTLIAYSLFQYIKLKKSIRAIEETLFDVEQGNGNRRILSKPRDVLSPVAFRINQMISTYEDQLSQLRSKEKITNQLLTSFSHDIRTPLTVIHAYLDAINNGDVVGEDKEAYLEVVREKAADLTTYTDSMFEWFKLNSKEYALYFETLDINEETRNILVNWIPVLEGNNIEYLVAIEDSPIEILVDKNAYYRIISNLLQNVVSHSQASKVEISVQDSMDSVSIYIADDGIGLSDKDVDHIFERLYTCDPSRKTAGSGLGLSITYELVQLLGGSISAESIPHTRTVFKIELSKHLNS